MFCQFKHSRPCCQRYSICQQMKRSSALRKWWKEYSTNTIKPYLKVLVMISQSFYNLKKNIPFHFGESSKFLLCIYRILREIVVVESIESFLATLIYHLSFLQCLVLFSAFYISCIRCITYSTGLTSKHSSIILFHIAFELVFGSIIWIIYKR